jgi:hypothetical protein
VDLIISPTTVAFNTQPGAPTPTFQAGEVVNALVLQLLENGNVRLSIGNSLLDVQTQVPLVPGTTIRLAVKSTGDGIKLVILDNGAASATANGVAAPVGRAPAATPGAINPAGVAGANVSDDYAISIDSAAGAGSCAGASRAGGGRPTERTSAIVRRRGRSHCARQCVRVAAVRA